MSLPAATLRLLPFYGEAELLAPGGRGLLIERLLEEGTESDLRFLAATLGEEDLRSWFRRHAGRKLSARSRAFWSVVLDAEPSPVPALAGELWPL